MLYIHIFKHYLILAKQENRCSKLQKWREEKCTKKCNIGKRIQNRMPALNTKDELCFKYIKGRWWCAFVWTIMIWVYLFFRSRPARIIRELWWVTKCCYNREARGVMLAVSGQTCPSVLSKRKFVSTLKFYIYPFLSGGTSFFLHIHNFTYLGYIFRTGCCNLFYPQLWDFINYHKALHQ